MSLRMKFRISMLTSLRLDAVNNYSSLCSNHSIRPDLTITHYSNHNIILSRDPFLYNDLILVNIFNQLVVTHTCHTANDSHRSSYDTDHYTHNPACRCSDCC